MIKLIFDTSILGHHLEYLHHIYDGIKVNDDKYVFIVPKEFEIVRDKFIWERKSNISFDYINKEYIDKLEGNGYLHSSWLYAKLINKYVRKYHASVLFLITLIHPYPFLPFLLPKNVKVSGIIYRLYVYEWERLSFLKRVKDIIETYVVAKSKKTNKAFLLNDSSSEYYYNKIYNSKKFQYIVDPVIPLTYNPKNVRHEFKLKEGDKMILHFGGMTTRKGTMLILEAATKMSDEQLKDKVFVFAGKVGNDIKDTFYRLIEQLKGKVRIYVFDEFCTYERLADLCYSCDCIVVPYRNYSYSSGVIGYSAQFQKTVIGPSQGILGKLIRRNKLGLTFPHFDAESLAKILFIDNSYKERKNDYAAKETVEAFAMTIMEAVMI